jgi:hypothetical protein
MARIRLHSKIQLHQTASPELPKQFNSRGNLALLPGPQWRCPVSHLPRLRSPIPFRSLVFSFLGRSSSLIRSLSIFSSCPRCTYHPIVASTILIPKTFCDLQLVILPNFR